MSAIRKCCPMSITADVKKVVDIPVATEEELGVGYVATDIEVEQGKTDRVVHPCGPAFTTPEQVSSEINKVSEGLNAHIQFTDVHGATPAAESDRIIIRDENGRAQIAAPVSDQDIANKKYVDESRVEYNIATPLENGLVPAGGKSNQYYGVNADGTAYEFKDLDLSAYATIDYVESNNYATIEYVDSKECELATPVKDGLVTQGGKAGQVYGVNEDGTAYEFKYLPVANKENLGCVIVGDGLEVEKTGRISVDFSEMPTNKFEELLRALRVPQWLNADRTWYVRTDGDDKNDGTENTPQKAFRTIQYAVDYVSENFNLGQYKGIIHIDAGTYEESVVLPKYTSGRGSILIEGIKDKTIVKAVDKNVFYATSASGIYTIKNLTCDISSKANDPTIMIAACCAAKGSILYLSSLVLKANEGAQALTSQLRLICADGGHIHLTDDIVIYANGRTDSSKISCILCDKAGEINHRGNGATVTVIGQASILCQVGGRGAFTMQAQYTPTPRFIDGGFIGKRCDVTNLSYINTKQKDLYFPGTIAGTVDATSVLV